VRTTLDIEDDVLQAAKELAQREGITIGAIVSKLARKGLTGAARSRPAVLRNGVPVLPQRDEVITLERIQQIMDSEAI
jgi:hypothetical protein